MKTRVTEIKKRVTKLNKRVIVLEIKQRAAENQAENN